MTRLEPRKAGRVALGLVLCGLICSAAFYLTRRIPDARGFFGGIGILAASQGAGLSIWCWLRLREWRSLLGLVLSIASLSFWCWVATRVSFV